MKKMLTMLLVAAMSFTMSGCQEKKPDLNEVVEAIENGTLTVEDALSKGWVDQEWVDQRNEEMSIPAVDKLTSNLLGEFETTTLSGETFSNKDLNSLTYFAFLDPTTDDAASIKEMLINTYPKLTDNGGDLLLVLMNDSTEGYEELPFNTVIYDDALKSALGSLSGMAEIANEKGFVGTWNGNNAFILAWQTTIDEETISSGLKTCTELLENNDNSTEIKTMG